MKENISGMSIGVGVWANIGNVYLVTDILSGGSRNALVDYAGGNSRVRHFVEIDNRLAVRRASFPSRRW